MGYRGSRKNDGIENSVRTMLGTGWRMGAWPGRDGAEMAQEDAVEFARYAAGV
jgi:hypothetical protein